MPQTKVAILMSTYNGEKYLRDQVMSILKQDYNDWHLYIRDDGSKDSTADIIREFVKSDERISFINESHPQNVGVTESFMKLLANVDADYYMFSDQDDYWQQDKVSATLAKMQDSEEKGQPVCVHTDLTIVDANLKGNELFYGPDYSWSGFRQLLFANCVTGCTVMINQPLKKLIDFNDKRLKNVYMHDWWIALIAAAFGKVVYLNRPTILYRQHSGNVIGESKKSNDWDNKVPANTRVIQTVRMAKDFWNAYQNKLRGKDRTYARKYASLAFHQNPFWNLLVILKCPPARQTFKGNLFFGFLIIKNYRILGRMGLANKAED